MRRYLAPLCGAFALAWLPGCSFFGQFFSLRPPPEPGGVLDLAATRADGHAGRAIVLGGGGTVGIAWEVGVLVGLARAGVAVADVDLVVGTSAGSVVGSELALGMTPEAMLETQLAPKHPPTPITYDLPRVMKTFRLLDQGPINAAVLRQVGVLSLEAKTESEAAYMQRFQYLAGETWPERRLALTSVDTADGSLHTWTRSSGVSLQLAVAASCAIPGVFPAVSIHGRREMDGGMRSPTNTDLASDKAAILVVAPVAPPKAELAALQGSHVIAITPDAQALEAMGRNHMDPAKAPDAARAGERQARLAVGQVARLWREVSRPTAPFQKKS